MNKFTFIVAALSLCACGSDGALGPDAGINGTYSLQGGTFYDSCSDTTIQIPEGGPRPGWFMDITDLGTTVLAAENNHLWVMQRNDDDSLSLVAPQSDVFQQLDGSVVIVSLDSMEISSVDDNNIFVVRNKRVWFGSGLYCLTHAEYDMSR